jgi:hypothetical protein
LELPCALITPRKPEQGAPPYSCIEFLFEDTERRFAEQRADF